MIFSLDDAALCILVVEGLVKIIDLGYVKRRFEILFLSSRLKSTGFWACTTRSGRKWLTKLTSRSPAQGKTAASGGYRINLCSFKGTTMG
jgi:hypothetical protein